MNLLGLTQQQLQDFFVHLGEKKFRAEQLMKWVYHRGVADFSQMSDISKALRDRLQTIACIEPPKVHKEEIAKDGTGKWVIEVASGSFVETIFIPEAKRGTLCVSSQAGCSLDCSFCSTGKQGFNSNLTAAEIIGQVWLVKRALERIYGDDEKRITNVVFMGMGEPLLNFNNVISVINLLMDDLGYGLSKRKVTLSTSGVVPKLRELGQHTDCALAVSLHAANDELRNTLVPINRKYPIAELLEATQDYIRGLKDKKRVVTIEYTLIANVNDEVSHADELIKLLAKVPCKINLIPFNPFPFTQYQKPSANRVRFFLQKLQDAGFNVTVRKTRGDDIDAACGQLVGQVEDKTKRSERYIKLRRVSV